MYQWTEDQELINQLSSLTPCLDWSHPDAAMIQNAVSFLIRAKPLEFGNRLKALRKSRNLTQRAMAVKIKTAFTTISGWEIGKNVPEAATIEKLADFFGLKSICPMLPLTPRENSNWLITFLPEDFKEFGTRFADIETMKAIHDQPEGDGSVRHRSDRDWMDASRFIPAPAFCFQITDDSMERASGVSIFKGAKVLCSCHDVADLSFFTNREDKRKVLDFCNDKLVVCSLDFHEGMLRELHYDDKEDTVTLNAWNESYEAQSFTGIGDDKNAAKLFCIYGIAFRLIADF